MTVVEAKKILDDLPDEYDIPVLSWLFEEKHPYLVSNDFHQFMKRLDDKDLDIKDILWEMSVLGDSQESLGNKHFVNNLWKLIEFTQTHL